MSTEVISFSCGKCERKLKVKAALAGRQAKCPGCGEPIKVPALQSAKATAPGVAQKPGAPKQASAVVRQPAAPQRPAVDDEFGLGNLGPDEDDVFAGAAPASQNPKNNPLANHVVADPGFAAADQLASAFAPDKDAEPTYSRNPLIVQMEKEQEFARQQQATLNNLKADAKADNPLKSPPVLLGLLFGIGLFVALLIGLAVEPAIGILICLILAIAAGPAVLGIQVWAIVLIAKYRQENKGLCIVLFLFVPFYNIIYSFKHWKEMKSYFGSLCVLFVTSNLCWVFMIIFGVLVAQRNG